VATNQKAGKNQQGRKKGNIFSHSQLCNQITRTRQARIRAVGPEVLPWRAKLKPFNPSAR
jgi:hypothetical protein